MKRKVEISERRDPAERRREVIPHTEEANPLGGKKEKKRFQRVKKIEEIPLKGEKNEEIIWRGEDKRRHPINEKQSH